MTLFGQNIFTGSHIFHRSTFLVATFRLCCEPDQKNQDCRVPQVTNILSDDVLFTLHMDGVGGSNMTLSE